MLNIPSSVKALFQADGVHKNFRVHFPNGEMADITNDNVVQESVKFTESLCSQSTFKFGLAEASVLEFETVGIGNMYGMTIEASCEIDCSSLSAADKATIAAGTWDGTWDSVNEVFAVPYGTFRVDSCPRDHQSMAHRQVTAYSIGLNKTKAIGMQEAMLNRYTQYAKYNLNTQEILACTVVGSDTDRLANFGFQDEDIDFSYSSTTGDNASPFYRWDGLDNDPNKFAGIRLKSGTVLKSARFGLSGEPVCTEGIAVIDYDEQLIDSQFKPLLASLHQKYDSRADSFGENRLGFGLKTPYPQMQFGYFETIGGSSNGYTDQGLETTLKIAGGVPFTPFGGVPPEKKGYTSTPYCAIGCIPGSFVIEEIVSENGVITERIDHPITVGSVTGKIWTATSSMGIDFQIAPTQTGLSVYYYVGSYNAFTGAVSFLDILQGYIELSALFAKTDRLGGFEEIHLDNSAPVSVVPGDYTEAWWDEFDVDPIGTVTVTYKGKDENGNETENTTNIFISSGQSVYDMTSNSSLKNLASQTLADITAMVDSSFKPHASTVSFTPIELDMQGWPWLEAGDALEIEAEDGTTVETYALRIEMNGIQNLQAVITAEGGEIIEEVD